MGYFKLDLIKSDHHPAMGGFLSEMNSVGFHLLISLPTRITSTSATLIDNILTNDFCRPISSGSVFTSISDHLLIFAIFGDSGRNLETGPRYTLKREMGIRSKERFRSWVQDWGMDFAPGVDSIVDDAIRFCRRREKKQQYYG